MGNLVSTLLMTLKLIILLKWHLSSFSIEKLTVFPAYTPSVASESPNPVHTLKNVFWIKNWSPPCVCFLVTDMHLKAICQNWTYRNPFKRKTKEIWFILTQSPTDKHLSHTKVGKTRNNNLTVVFYDCVRHWVMSNSGLPIHFF